VIVHDCKLYTVLRISLVGRVFETPSDYVSDRRLCWEHWIMQQEWIISRFKENDPLAESQYADFVCTKWQRRTLPKDGQLIFTLTNTKDSDLQNIQILPERTLQNCVKYTVLCHIHWQVPTWCHGKSMKAVLMCFVWIWEQTAIISLNSINWLVFITEI
jgi:hypothetical protein